MKVILFTLILCQYATNINGATCADLKKECRIFMTKGYCQKFYQTFMFQNCKKSCGFCPTSSKCHDSAKPKRKCHVWKSRNFCSRGSAYFGHMNKLCKQTCGLCKLTPTPKLTKATTVTAKTTTTAPSTTEKNGATCADLKKECRIFMTKGYCQKFYQKFMFQNCKKSCGFCSTSSKCHDSAKPKRKCHVWKSRNFCSRGSAYFGHMNKLCKQTCGLCKLKPTPKLTKATTVTAKTTTTAASTTEKNGNTTAKPLVCGIEKSGISLFVISGSRASPSTWIWQAGIYLNNQYSCGGSLITTQHVLTAAHCVKNIRKEVMMVYLGDHTRNAKDGREMKFEVESSKYHDEYNVKTVDNDIAILKLKGTVKLSQDIGLVCLPEANEVVPVGKSCYITGWGRTVDKGAAANVLQEAELPIVSNLQCGKRNVNNLKESKITPNMVCAGFKSGSKVSGCQGDSGGPLVCKSKENKWVLQGVVSWGSRDCDADKRYTVFSRTSKFIDWINKNL